MNLNVSLYSLYMITVDLFKSCFVGVAISGREELLFVYH